MSTAPLVWAIVLNWNRPVQTIECLHALRDSDYTNLHCLVVDNGSSDNSVLTLRDQFPDIQLISNDSNLGYAEGNNRGIRWALAKGAHYVLVVNDDLIVERDTLGHLVEAMSDPAVAAAGCKVRLYEQPERLWAAGEGFPREIGYPIDDGSFDRARDIDYVVGCCILMSEEALQKVGLFDPRLFAVHEERAWCHRARQVGYRIRYVPSAQVRHKVSLSFTSGRSPGYHYLFVRNRLFLLEQQGLVPSSWRGIRGACHIWRQEVRLIRAQGGDSRQVRAATLGAIDYLRDRSGPPPAGLLL